MFIMGGTLAFGMVKSLFLFALLLAGLSFAWEENSTTGWAGAFDQTIAINNQVMLNHNQTGLVTYFDFEDGGGNVSYDYTKANNGTLYNGVARTASGKYGSALQFDGVNDYVDAGSATIGIPFTVEAWVYATSWPASNAIVEVTDGANKRIGLESEGVSNSQSIFYWVNPNYVTWRTSKPNAGQWVHIVGVINGTSSSDGKIYYNGVAQSASFSSGGSPASPASANIRIGAISSSQYFFNGFIDEVRIYNRTLSAAEINASMNGQVRYTSGNYTSLSLDAGAGNEWKNVSAVFSDGGANTSMDMYAAVNNDNLTWAFALVQANAANNTAYHLATAGRYLKIRINEKTINGAYTDRLQKITAVPGIASDTTPPSVLIASPGSTTYATSTAPVSFTATDNTGISSCNVFLNGTVNSSTCSNYTLTLLNGAYNLTVTANDTAGNTNSTQVSFTVAMPAGPQTNITQVTTDINGLAAGNLSFSFMPNTLKISTGAQEQSKAIKASAGVNKLEINAKINLSGQAVSGKQITYTISE